MRSTRLSPAAMPAGIAKRFGPAADRVPFDTAFASSTPTARGRAIESPATEPVSCYLCGSSRWRHFCWAEDDLTGKPGRFRFVRCDRCGLVYQNPRIPAAAIAAWYDDEYNAHRKQTDFGLFTPLYRWAMERHDRRKHALVRRYAELGGKSRVLDLGCGAGTFLARVHAETGAHVTGVDFKDLSQLPWMAGVEFHCARPRDCSFDRASFDLITMWHFLEHDYDPRDTLQRTRDWLAPGARMVIEVPHLLSVSARLFGERWPGLQAPQHTVLYQRETLVRMVEGAGLRVVDWLPWGAFPAYFYLFAGTAFRLLRGRGLNLSRAVYPYFVGELLLSPLLLFEKQLNLAMQTVVVERVRA